jgi:hypothetical protein
METTGEFWLVNTFSSSRGLEKSRSIARDPVVFPDPERFDPQRWVTPDGNAIREDLKVFQFGFGRRVSVDFHSPL